MRIWPWSLIRDLEWDNNAQAVQLAELRVTLRIAQEEKAAETARRISAEALALDRKQALERAMADIVKATDRAEATQDKLVQALVEANARLSAPREEKPPDMAKIREMAPLGGEEATSPMLRARRADIAVRRALFEKYYPMLVAKMKPTPPDAEGPPPGADERPSLEATG
jgi:hypothetical protein